MRQKRILIAVIVIAGAATVYQLMSARPGVSVQDLIKQEEALNEGCRGGSGDNPTTMQACIQRDRLVESIRDKGWCYGSEGQAGYQKHWQPCDAIKEAIAPVNSKASDEIHFDQGDAEKKAMLSQMEAGTASCSNRLIRGLLRQGMRSRSQILETTVGICGQGIKKFLGMQRVPPAAADQYAQSSVMAVLDDILRDQ